MQFWLPILLCGGFRAWHPDSATRSLHCLRWVNPSTQYVAENSLYMYPVLIVCENVKPPTVLAHWVTRFTKSEQVPYKIQNILTFQVTALYKQCEISKFPSQTWPFAFSLTGSLQDVLRAMSAAVFCMATDCGDLIAYCLWLVGNFLAEKWWDPREQNQQSIWIHFQGDRNAVARIASSGLLVLFASAPQALSQSLLTFAEFMDHHWCPKTPHYVPLSLFGIKRDWIWFKNESNGCSTVPPKARKLLNLMMFSSTSPGIMTVFASSSCQLHISGAHWAGSAAGLRISTVSPQIGGFRML
jgi:hypothetical protein